MTPEMPRDPIAQLVLEELRAMRQEINARIDKLVTTEAFAAEQRRVDERLADLGSDLVAEREARMAAITSEVGALDRRLNAWVRIVYTLAGGLGAMLLAILTIVLPHVRWG